MSASTTPADLADFLEQESQSIISEWAARIKADPTVEPSSHLSFEELADHLPAVFSRLIEQIREFDPSRKLDDLREDASKHGLHRWQQNFKVEEVVREIGLICRMAMRRLSSFRSEKPATEDLLDVGRDLIARHFDQIAIYSIRQFVELQQEKLLQANEEAAKLNQQLTQLDARRLRTLRTVTHEIRNHLNSIRIGVSLSLMETESTVNREHLGVINDQLEALSSFSSDLMQYATVSGASDMPNIGPLDVPSLFNEISVFMHELTNQKRLRFIASCDPGIGMVNADRQRVLSILVNLATNAVKYTQEGEVQLRFAPGPKEHEWHFSVEDTGVGIAKSEQSKVFEEFYRVPATASQKGNGLGLAITHHLVRSLGGRIELESQPGEGSTFTVVLPRDPEPGGA